jgi:hypothetical protein
MGIQHSEIEVFVDAVVGGGLADPPVHRSSTALQLLFHDHPPSMSARLHAERSV